MEFAFAFALALPFGGPPQHAPADSWFARDKLNHFVVSFVTQGVGHAVLRERGLEYREAAWTAGAFTAALGLSKEAWDVRRGRAFSWKDLAADAAGAGTAAVVIRQVAP